MRVVLAALFLCLAVPAQAAPVDQFTGDRYRMAYGGASDVAKAVQKQRAKKPKVKKNYRPPGYPVVRVKRPRKTLIGGLVREIRRALPSRLGGRDEPIIFQRV